MKLYQKENLSKIHIKQKEWRIKNEEQLRLKNKLHYQLNREKRLAQNKLYQSKNKEKYRIYVQRYRLSHPEKIKEIAQRRCKNREYKISSSVGKRIWKDLHGNKKGRHWEELVNYTLEDLKQHLEFQFKKNMTWDNYGKWHIDHIIPVSFFQFNDVSDVEFKMCWRLDNLQPLWRCENMKKGNRIEY